MDSLQCLNAFISERLTAAAVDIYRTVEKTLREYEGEISRSKQEIDHLRTLVLWPEVTLQRSAAHQFSPRCCDPDCCHEEEEEEEEGWVPQVSPDHLSTLHVKEEPDQRADWQGASCRQHSDTTGSPQSVRGEGHQEPSSHFYRILTVQQTAHIKAEPDGDEFITSTREPEIPCRISPESSGRQQETLIGALEITHEQDGPDEQQHTAQDWSPCQDPEPPQIKVEKLASSSRQEERCVHNEPRSPSPRRDQSLIKQIFYTADEKRRDAEGEGCQLSGLSRASQPFYSVNHNENGENTEGVVNGGWIKTFRATTRPKKRQNSNLCSEGRESMGVEEDVNDLTRERRHTCPICAKRFKESSHLKDHVRIHTGEKPYQCKECGMNFRQSGALTLHMRIHTGERPYECAACGRCFNRKGDMETHRVTHTGERPHLCVVCGKSFKRKSNLNTHLKIHAEGKLVYTQPL